MAKKTGGKLAGKTVAFVGKFGYPNLYKEDYAAMAQASGGAVVASVKNPDFLWVGDSGVKLPPDVTKVQKKNPAVVVYRSEDFMQFLVPEPATLIQELKRPAHKDDSFWKAMAMMLHCVKAKVDLSQADLRKVKLDKVHLSYAILEGADLQECRANETKFPPLKNANLCAATGLEAQFGELDHCQFRAAKLPGAWFSIYRSSTVTACDFTSATLNEALLYDTAFQSCKFTSADLSDARGRKTTSFEDCDFTQANLARLRAAEAKFSDCNFTRANLERADLRGASLVGANLRDADLRNAVLCDADLTGADVAGADFQGAELGGAKTNNVDFCKAKNYQTPVIRKAGPKIKQFSSAAAGAKNFSTQAHVDLNKGETVELLIFSTKHGFYASWDYSHRGAKKKIEESFDAKTLERALLGLALRWPGGTLHVGDIEADRTPAAKGVNLAELAAAAWSEAFSTPAPTSEQHATDREQRKSDLHQERDALLKKVRKQGIKAWNEHDEAARRRFDLRGADFSGARLDKIELALRDLTGANFTGASLPDAWASGAQFAKVNFTGANLQRARAFQANFSGANFTNADLTETVLGQTKLQGADLTGAKLKGADLKKAEFDDQTVFPKGFAIPLEMNWKGKGPRPGAKKVKAKSAGSLPFEDFVKALNKQIEFSRMHKAGAMLKKEKFQLFAEVTDDALGGVVKSQTDKDLVYSCRLTSQGDFGCCTQNLNACGGLRGALCKHLLVLIIGLAQAGQIDSATVDYWVKLSRTQKPKVDSDSMTAMFLKHKGAEAGEIDWRPTETIPEDFYSM